MAIGKQVNKYVSELMWAHNIPQNMTSFDYLNEMAGGDIVSMREIMGDKDFNEVLYINAFKRTSLIHPALTLRSILEADRVSNHLFDSCIRDGKWSSAAYDEVKKNGSWGVMNGKNSFLINVVLFYLYHLSQGVMQVDEADVPRFQELLNEFSQIFKEEVRCEVVFDHQTDTLHVWFSKDIRRVGSLLPSRIIKDTKERLPWAPLEQQQSLADGARPQRARGMILELGKEEDAWLSWKEAVHLEKVIAPAIAPSKPRVRL